MAASPHPQACADKLDRELSTFGIPPQFPPEEEVECEAEEGTSAEAAAAAQTAAAGAEVGGTGVGSGFRSWLLLC